MIQLCVCEHDYQDVTYGKQMRVFNPRQGNKAPRCSVCGKDGKGDPGAAPKKKGK